MARVNRLISHLPSLYRPEGNDQSILKALLQQWGKELDSLSSQMTDVMQAHWHGFADRAQYNAYFNRDRQQRDLPPIMPNTSVTEERQLLNEFPYINELARLGALLELPVWREPPELRENVESYRIRLLKMFEIYRNGLGTLEAMRAIVEANLPLNMTVPVVHRQRSFSIEEYAPLAIREQDALSRGAPLNIVGPLMRWDLTNESLHAVAPTVFIEGVAAAEGEFDATERPLIELMGGDGQPSVGLAYNQTLAPNAVLRLSPLPVTFLATANDLLLATGKANHEIANSNWQANADFSGGDIRLLAQTREQTVWAVVDNAGTSELWRYQGNDWLRVQAGFDFANIVMLKALDHELFIGDDNGLHIVNSLPEVEDDYQLETSTLFSVPVYDLIFDGSVFWFATEEGVFNAPPDASTATATPIEAATYCIAEHEERSLYFGGELGLVHLHRGYDRWTHLLAESSSDLNPDWLPFDGDAPATSYLPVVTDLAIASDSSLWIATEQGLVRYFCFRSSDSGLAYSTQLQAFPDITQGRVSQIGFDASGLLWVCAESGLLRFDGRDFLQYLETDDRWEALGTSASLYPDDLVPEDRGRWRFNRSLSTSSWEHFDTASDSWVVSTPALRNETGRNVQALLWCHSLQAELGTWDGDSFVADPDPLVPLSDFSVRVKRSVTQIIEGGMVALPALPKGRSTWRYLSVELAPLNEPVNMPWWSKEGRLVPESGDEVAPYPGRYRLANPEPKRPALPAGRYDEVVFSYLPAAKVQFSWPEKNVFSLIVRLSKRSNDEAIHPAILDRVWQGMQKVKPAGARLMLAVENEIVRGIES